MFCFQKTPVGDNGVKGDNCADGVGGGSGDNFDNGVYGANGDNFANGDISIKWC